MKSMPMVAVSMLECKGQQSKVCAGCGRDFYKIYINSSGSRRAIKRHEWLHREYCSQSCNYRKHDQYKSCVNCRNLYCDTKRDQQGRVVRRVNPVKWAKSQWCSQKCRWVTQKAVYEQKICKQCGAIFDNRAKNGAKKGTVVHSARFKKREVCSNLCHLIYDQRRTPMEIFKANVGKQNARSCLMWLGHRQHRGHGRVEMAQAKGRGILAHRLSYALFRGPVPANRLVCHECDVAGCVNPKHLYLGDYATNGADRAKKSRPKASDVQCTKFLGVSVVGNKIILTDAAGNSVNFVTKGVRGRKQKSRESKQGDNLII